MFYYFLLHSSCSGKYPPQTTKTAGRSLRSDGNGCFSAKRSQRQRYAPACCQEPPQGELPLCGKRGWPGPFESALKKINHHHFRDGDLVGAGGFAFLRKSHGGCSVPPAHCQEPPFESHPQKNKTATPDGVTVLLVGAGGFEPPKSSTTDLQSAPFGHSGTLPYSIRCEKRWSW